MTVQQMIDLVTFLHSTYTEVARDYRGYTTIRRAD